MVQRARVRRRVRLRLGKRVLHCILDHPLQGPRAKLRIITTCCQPVSSIITQAQADPAVGKPCLQSGKLDTDNSPHMRRCQTVEQQDLVKPVQKFRTEG